MLEQFGLIGNIAILAASLAVLMKASSLAINNSVKLAAVTGLGKSKVGFILVAFATSLPELFVAAFAALDPKTIGLSVGNVLGSNIVNICLVLGVGFLIMAFKYPESAGFFTKMAKDEVGNLNFGLFIASIVPLILLYFRLANQIVGAVLVVLFAYNMYLIVRQKRIVEEISEDVEKSGFGKYLIKSIVGIAGVVVSAYLIVESGSFLAISVGIPSVIVGATVVAFGTSVPELATGIESFRKGFVDLAIGNVVGSCFINITLILGLTLLLSPLNLNVSAFSNLIIFSLISNLILWYFLQNSKISKREGAILLVCYFLFLAVTFGNVGP